MHGIKGVSMTNTSTLTLDGVSFQLPDGSLLFSDLDETFDTRHTGLVGRNGGEHADNNVDIQEFMVQPVGAKPPSSPTAVFRPRAFSTALR